MMALKKAVLFSLTLHNAQNLFLRPISWKSMWPEIRHCKQVKHAIIRPQLPIFALAKMGIFLAQSQKACSKLVTAGSGIPPNFEMERI